jgi:hypothetical protein
MAIYAIHDGSNVVNVVVADSLESAQANADGNLQVDEVTDGLVSVGWEAHDGYWRPLATYPSWVWNADSREWEAPIPEPEPTEELLHYWDEGTVSWVAYERPVG